MNVCFPYVLRDALNELMIEAGQGGVTAAPSHAAFSAIELDGSTNQI